MWRIGFAWLAAIGLGCCAGPVRADEPDVQVTFYIAADGNDRFSGRLPVADLEETDGPFASPGRARDAIRALKAQQNGQLRRPVSVIFTGDCHLAETLTLTPADSGTAECPITYAARPGKQTRITGGQVIRGWKPGPDGLWTVELPEVKQGKWTFRQLFVAKPGQPYFERRYRPDLGVFVIAGLTDAPVFPSSQRHRQSQQEFRFVAGDIKPWANLDDVEIVALHDWSSSRLRIDELDLENQVVKFTGYPVYRIGHWFKDGKNPYFVENVHEAGIAPGRWYLDRPSGTLTYRPAGGEDVEQLVVVAPRTEVLLRLSGDVRGGKFVEHVHFRGLTFCHTSWTLPEKGYSSGQGMVDLPAAVDAIAARNCRFERCTFAHLGAYAVRLGAGCRDNRIVGNRMFDLGGGGVMVGVTDRRSTPPVTPGGNQIANNVISDGGLVHYSAHGVWIGIAERTRLSHNVVRRFPYSNVSVGWSWNDQPTACRENVIEYNHIHDALMLLADGGGIYSLGAQPGTVLRGNLIHAVHRSRFAGRAPNNGIFFDQGSKGFLVEGNVIYDTAQDAIRYNQSQSQWHTFRGNSLGIGPDDERFPRVAADRAGLEPAFRDLDAERPKITPTPLLSMEFREK